MKNLIRSLLAATLVGLSCFSPVHATALTDTYENSIIDWLMRAQSLTPPTTGAYVALFTTCPTGDTGAGFTEVTGTGYSRKNYAASLANWSATSTTSGTSASAGTDGTTGNNNAITFDPATADWGTVNCVGYMTASSGGTMIWYTTLTAARNITNGSTASFAADALTFQIDN
jgi:hypothetical protein